MGKHSAERDRSRIGIPRPEHPLLARLIDLLDLVALLAVALLVTATIRTYVVAEGAVVQWFEPGHPAGQTEVTE